MTRETTRKEYNEGDLLIPKEAFLIKGGTISYHVEDAID